MSLAGLLAGGPFASGLAVQPPLSFGATVAIERRSEGATLTFDGTLQRADSPDGPWLDLPEAVSPLTIDLAAGPKFFRSRAPALESIFSSRSIAELTVSGPLQQHFDLALAGLPDGIFPPVREKPYFEATVALEGAVLPARLRVRGNSSLQECPFPKLKFKIRPEDRADTPFFDAREVKIATHCADGGEGNVGRLRDERAAFREALAYETMEFLGFISPRVRRAQMTYRDTSPPAPNGSEKGWEVARKSMLLDDIEVVAERMEGRALEDEEIAALKDAGFDEQLIADLELLHALLGNWDYALSVDGQELWNTDVIELPDKQLVPVAGDFDLASFVTGQVRRSAPHDYHPELPDLDREALYRVDEARKNAGSERFRTAAARFESQRPGLEALINSAEVDDAGRINALRHVEAFFNALAAAAGR